MSAEWNPFAMAGIVTGALNIALAIAIYVARPDMRQNRLLALALFFNGCQAAAFMGADLLFSDAATLLAFRAVSMTTLVAFFWAYLLFLSTLDTPLVRPIRHPVGNWAIHVLFALILVFLYATRLSSGPFQVVDTIVGSVIESNPSPLISFVFQDFLQILIPLFGMIVAISAWRRAQTPILRHRMFWYMVAFVSHDAFVVVFQFPRLSTIIFGVPQNFGPLWGFVFDNLHHAVVGIFLAYGILKTQLFDVDLRIKWTLHKGTIAAAFVAAFFFVSEIAASVLSARMGLLLGVGAAALLVFFIAPISRVADRLADRAMPDVHDTDEYRAWRRLEIYRGALEEVYLDGSVSVKDQAILSRLRGQLEIDDTTAIRLERDVKKFLQAQ